MQMQEHHLYQYAPLQVAGPGGGHLLVSSVPMREQKNDEKLYFFRAGQCAALSSFRVAKMLFL